MNLRYLLVFIYIYMQNVYGNQVETGLKHVSNEASKRRRRIDAWIADQIHDPFSIHPLRQCSLVVCERERERESSTPPLNHSFFNNRQIPL